MKLIDLPFQRNSTVIALARALTALLVLVGLTFVGMVPAQAEARGDITLEDTAGIIYQPQLYSELDKVKFYKPTKVVIYTYKGSTYSFINADVLSYAREKHPEWLSKDGQKWADGLFIIAVDPEGRHVGTYFGEDRKLSLDQQSDVQDATKNDLREANWTEGTLEGIKKAASLIHRPWYLSAGFFIFLAIVGSLSVVVCGYAIGSRSRNRKKFANYFTQGDKAYSAVTMDLEVTELNAQTIPSQSEYGAVVLERWRTFEEKYRDATKLRSNLDAATKKQRSTSAWVRKASDFRAQADELDGLDDAIADANSLLNMSQSWQSAWQRQTGSLAQDCSQIRSMLKNPETAGSPSSAESVRAETEQLQAHLEEWGAGLAEGKITPDEALDSLKEGRQELGKALSIHAEAIIQNKAKDQREVDAMRNAMSRSERDWDSTGRARNSSIVDIRYPSLPIVSYSYVSSSYSAAQSAYSDIQSSSSSTGYGSSGGSFSGSGSSSSF